MPAPQYQPAGAFTLIPDAVRQSAASLGSLASESTHPAQALGAAKPLSLLADAPYIGQFAQAASAALSAQHERVTQLADYGRSASEALTSLVTAARSAEEAGAHRFAAFPFGSFGTQGGDAL